MDYLAQVQCGIDYIEDHLDVDIHPLDVARHAGLSQWHFQRIFKALTNETLKTYIRTRRFSQSLEKLARTKARVLDIAIAAGFESQASFTRAFRKAFGVTPADYRKHPSSVCFLSKPKLDATYLEHIHANVSLEPEIIDSPALNLVGLRTRFFGAESEKNNMANKLPQLWNDFLPRLDSIPNRDLSGCYGVMQPVNERTDELDYWAVAPVPQIEPIPDGLVSVQIPAARYARFAHRGRYLSLNLTVNYIYSNWLIRSEVRHTGGSDYEFYGGEYLPDSDQSVIYYGIPIDSVPDS